MAVGVVAQFADVSCQRLGAFGPSPKSSAPMRWAKANKWEGFGWAFCGSMWAGKRSREVKTRKVFLPTNTNKIEKTIINVPPLGREFVEKGVGRFQAHPAGR
jgi:hypothetical protein